MLSCRDGGASYSGPLFPLSCAAVLPEMLAESLSLHNIHFKEMRKAQLAPKGCVFIPELTFLLGADFLGHFGSF